MISFGCVDHHFRAPWDDDLGGRVAAFMQARGFAQRLFQYRGINPTAIRQQYRAGHGQSAMELSSPPLDTHFSRSWPALDEERAASVFLRSDSMVAQAAFSAPEGQAVHRQV